MGLTNCILCFLILANCFHFVRSECINAYTSCDYWASVGECEININMMCFCSESCNTSSECRGNNTDTKCSCAKLASRGLCEHGTASEICPFTCQLRQNVTCGQPEQYANAVAIGNWTYMDRVTYTCLKGYIDNGGAGLRICSESGQWVLTNAVPDCVLDTSEPTPCQNQIMAFEHVKKNSVNSVSILHSSSGGNVLDCADWCLRLLGCTHFAYKNGICDIYYYTQHANLGPRNGKVWNKIYFGI